MLLDKPLDQGEAETEAAIAASDGGVILASNRRGIISGEIPAPVSSRVKSLSLCKAYAQ